MSGGAYTHWGRFERALNAQNIVKHDPRAGCRNTGGATCTYLIAGGTGAMKD